MLDEMFEKIKKNIEDKAGDLGKKTENFVEIQKLKSQIHTANREIAQNYAELGEMIFRKYQAGEIEDAEMIAICEDIADLKGEVASCKEEITEYRGENTCPECGASLPNGAAFCMKCGAQMPVSEAEFEEGEVVNPSDADADAVQAAEEVAEEAAAEADAEVEAAEAGAAVEEAEN